MPLADTFQEIVDSLPDDWTDLEFDLRIFDERRYIDAAVYLASVNAQPYSKHDWHWRILVAHRFGHAASAPAVHAAELPVRKAGLWEMKMVRSGSPTPETTMQHCTDESTDKEMSTTFSPLSKDLCSKQDTQKTATGYVTDSVCSMAGVSMTSHSEITGDFNSAYTVKSKSHNEGGPASVPADSTTTVEAKWLGACKPDQKPGDIVLPGGMKMNVKDMEKLKALMPKPK